MTALFFKAVALALVTLVLVLALKHQAPEVGLVLGMAACVLVLMAAFTWLEPVMEFLHRLEELGNLQSGVMTILLKTAGIGLICEMAGALLSDGGNAALARGIQLLGTAVILYLSIPVFELLLELVQQILGAL